MAAAYFTRVAGPDREHARVSQVFTPGEGWVRATWQKRISPTWARKLGREGVTAVALASEGHLADFNIKELSR